MSSNDGTHIVGHLAHQLARHVQKDGLQIGLAAGLRLGLENLNALGQIRRERDISQKLEIPVTQEAQAGFALDLPEFAVRIDDAMAKQVPQGLLHKRALGKDGLVAEDKVQVGRVVDDDAGRQRGHVELEGLAAKEPLAASKVGKEGVAILQEVETVADQGKRVWRASGVSGQ